VNCAGEGWGISPEVVWAAVVVVVLVSSVGVREGVRPEEEWRLIVLGVGVTERDLDMQRWAGGTGSADEGRRRTVSTH
jgi:hypothetical protein